MLSSDIVSWWSTRDVLEPNLHTLHEATFNVTLKHRYSEDKKPIYIESIFYEVLSEFLLLSLFFFLALEFNLSLSARREAKVVAF